MHDVDPAFYAGQNTAGAEEENKIFASTGPVEEIRPGAGFGTGPRICCVPETDEDFWWSVIVHDRLDHTFGT